ncbi:MAG: hypothetical protein WA323_02570 [Candidatus Nitrosopolaris sp.]
MTITCKSYCNSIQNMKQIIFGTVIALLFSGFFVEQAFAQVNGTNGGIAGGGTKGGVGGNGGIGTSGSTINGKNGTSANGHSVGGTTSSGGD